MLRGNFMDNKMNYNTTKEIFESKLLQSCDISYNANTLTHIKVGRD